MKQLERIQLLRRFCQAYENLLHNPLQGAARLELGFVEKGDEAIDASYHFMCAIGKEEFLLPAEISILQAFDDAGQELLILGEPGAGKSTVLFELALQLIMRAENDEQHALPVIVPLSSWALKRLPLQNWLAEQISQIYDISLQLCECWVNEQQFLPLLDGLDEMDEAARPDCIAAINAYHREHPGMLVVCSRAAEYDALTQRQRLAFKEAVIVEPLSKEQVDAALVRAGEPLEALRQAITENTVLQGMVTTPLILNVFMLTYHEVSALSLLQKGAPLQQHMWNDYYVQRMMLRKENTVHYPLQRTQKWLHWLARQMQIHNEPILWLEQLQPDWLPERQRTLYRWSAGLAFGLIGALLGGLICGLIGAVAGGLIFGLLGMLTEKIESAGAFTWLWRRTRSVLLTGLLVGLLIGLLGALVYSLVSSLSIGVNPLGLFYWLFIGLPDGLRIGLLIGPLGGLLTSVAYGFTTKQLTDRFTLFPNEGMRRSAKNGLVGALIGALLGTLSSILLGNLAFILIGMLVGGLIFGLRSVLQHFILRFWLCQSQRFPWRVQRFLDDAVDRILMQCVGGGYSFIHSLLLDYFANLDERDLFNTKQS